MTALPANQYIIGVDLGGTNIVVCAMSADGSRQYGLRSEPTTAQEGADGVIGRMARMVNDTVSDTMREAGVAREAFLGVGVGAPGPLDREKGIVLVAPNLNWHNIPLRDRMAELTALPAALDNDANCATYGEWWVGAAKGATNVIGMTIGTGMVVASSSTVGSIMARVMWRVRSATSRSTRRAVAVAAATTGVSKRMRRARRSPSGRAKHCRSISRRFSPRW